MKIKWMGHSCFLITSNNGVRVLTDPFDEDVGYELPAVEVDIVTTSHSHSDHSNVKIVKGDFNCFKSPGIFSQNDVEIIGISTFHDMTKGLQRGRNVVFKFVIDGLNICHCGDLGHELTFKQIKEIGKLDILMLPVGGIYTIDAKGAKEIIELLKPVVAIPMHYKTNALKISLDEVDGFLTAMGGGKRVGTQEIEVNSGNLSEYAGVVVLDYK